ncbi:hypothetical protein P3T76_000538 [Phytophthora citrophthora]|uniref:Uncharacterized protein n=1 Tax=Phytophthora citrophthora TaxID=4793 RepID=A0AAD9LSU0_9STRA|nr:hypothetical protein P3T76_000538 [Phytophthora citrophthora]
MKARCRERRLELVQHSTHAFHVKQTVISISPTPMLTPMITVFELLLPPELSSLSLPYRLPSIQQSTRQ